MAKRRKPRAIPAVASAHTPESSGPRWLNVSAMRLACWHKSSSASSGACKKPTRPHITTPSCRLLSLSPSSTAHPNQIVIKALVLLNHPPNLEMLRHPRTGAFSQDSTFWRRQYKQILYRCRQPSHIARQHHPSRIAYDVSRISHVRDHARHATGHSLT